MYVCCFNNFTLVFEKEFFFQTTKQNIYCTACYPLVGHAVIASDYRADGTWFDTRCSQPISLSIVVLTKDLSCRLVGKPVMLGF